MIEGKRRMTTISESQPCPVTYRGILSRDIERLVQLHDLCFPVKYDAKFYEWLLSPACISLVAVTAADGEAASTAAEPSRSPPERVVGFCIGRLKFVEGALTTQPVGYISTFGVDPDYRQRGVGNELLERFIALLLDQRVPNASVCCAVLSGRRHHRVRQVWLHCLASDQRIVSYYLKRNFVEVERLKDFYEFPTGEGSVMRHDALLMCRVEEPSTTAARRKRDGGQRSRSQRTPACSFWDRCSGTTRSDTLEAQDFLVAQCGGVSVSTTCAVVCVAMTLVGGVFILITALESRRFQR